MAQQKARNTPDSREVNEEEKKIDIHIGVFFDGTGNSKLNIDEYKKKSAVRDPTKRSELMKKFERKPDNYESYRSEYSNVAELSELYDIKSSATKKLFFSKVYIEGSGTVIREEGVEDGEDDRQFGLAMATGETGVNEKVERGCEKIVAAVQKIMNSKENKKTTGIKILKLDVFGFSRGAAVARRFVSCIERTKVASVKKTRKCEFSFYVESLRAVLKKKGIEVEKIEPCFMGIYDTVSSYGVTGLFFHNDVKKLDLDVSKPEKVVHLTAADDYRKYFSLTRINTAKENTKVEIVLPGAHSDVGGGYKKREEENIILRKRYYGATCGSSHQIITYAGFKTREDLIKEGWYGENDTERTITNAYAVITLLLMGEYAEEFRAKMFDINAMKRKQIKEELKNIKDRIFEIKANPGGRALYSFENLNGSSETDSAEKKNSARVKITPIFKENDADFLLIKLIRKNYLHLSAKKGIAMSPENDKIRYIVNDNV